MKITELEAKKNLYDIVSKCGLNHYSFFDIEKLEESTFKIYHSYGFCVIIEKYYDENDNCKYFYSDSIFDGFSRINVFEFYAKLNAEIPKMNKRLIELRINLEVPFQNDEYYAEYNSRIKELEYILENKIWIQ